MVVRLSRRLRLIQGMQLRGQRGFKVGVLLAAAWLLLQMRVCVAVGVWLELTGLLMMCMGLWVL